MKQSRRFFLGLAASGLAVSSLPNFVSAQDPKPSQVIDDLAHRAFEWFVRNRNEKTGLVLDRAPNQKNDNRRPNLCSIASVGYYLSALPGAVKLGWIKPDVAREQTRQTLTTLWEKLPHHRGLYHHFYSAKDGTTSPNSEISALDTAICLNGVMVVGQYYGKELGDKELGELADKILDRADWKSLERDDPETKKPILAMSLEKSADSKDYVIGYQMTTRSSEFAMPYFLAVGSRTFSVDPQRWYNTVIPMDKPLGKPVPFGSLPLFLSYYSLSWHRLDGLVDREGIDHNEIARQVALSNREYCRSIADRFKTYKIENGGWWGLSAGDSPVGYVAAAPQRKKGLGTVWPTTALAALTWIPDEIESDLVAWQKSSIWSDVNCDYGLAPFSLDQEKPWIGRDLIGIDLGSFLLNWMNTRTGIVRNLWTDHPIGQNALTRLEYKKITK